MSWSQLTIVVDADQVEPVSSMLEAFLAQAVTTENAGKDEFYEVAFPGTPDWQKVRISGLFDINVELAPIIDFIQNNIESDDEIPFTVTELVDQDWQRVWLESFKPVKVGNELWVCPSWCEPTEPDSRNIILDPGLAFGTGTHATTAMCLAWLAEQNLNNQTVLDYGSGSGILAIGALLANAQHADAVDIDPLAVDACNLNAQRNNISANFNAYLPQDLPNNTQYNLVIANILADVIIELRDTLLQHLKGNLSNNIDSSDSNSTLLLTGILATQAEKVKQAFSSEFSFDTQMQDQWCLLIGTRNNNK